MSDADPLPAVELRPVDEDVLERMVRAAVADASADEVTPSLTPGTAWTPARLDWMRALHRDCRAGLGGPAGQATWAVIAGGEVVGSVRLRRMPESSSGEIGIWLTRAARGRGVGRCAVRAVLAEARAHGLARVRADTTAGNGAALAVLRDLGFDCAPVGDGDVTAWLALDG